MLIMENLMTKRAIAQSRNVVETNRKKRDKSTKNHLLNAGAHHIFFATCTLRASIRSAASDFLTAGTAGQAVLLTLLCLTGAGVAAVAICDLSWQRGDRQHEAHMNDIDGEVVGEKFCAGKECEGD